VVLGAGVYGLVVVVVRPELVQQSVFLFIASDYKPKPGGVVAYVDSLSRASSISEPRSGCRRSCRRTTGPAGLPLRKEVRCIPDEEVGLLFWASDVSVLPYRRIYQSGVLALPDAQAVPVIVADVDTGLVFAAGSVLDLA
jgi:hypothetical protein